MATGSTNRLFEQFWAFVNRRAEQTALGPRLGKATSKQYHRFRVEASDAGFHISMAVQRTDEDIECQLVIESADPTKDFERLKSQKDEIEAELGTKLNWYPIDDRNRCKVTQRRGYGSIERHSERRDLADWLLQRAQAFDAAFGPRIGAQ